MRAVASERDKGRRRRWRKEAGRLHCSLSGPPSGRHKSSDVTNAVNVLACLQYGLLERAKPIGALSPHLHISKTHPGKQFKLLSRFIFQPQLGLIEYDPLLKVQAICFGHVDG